MFVYIAYPRITRCKIMSLHFRRRGVQAGKWDFNAYESEHQGELNTEALLHAIRCPLTLGVMLDPVRIQGESPEHVFERYAIDAHFQERSTNPMTNLEVKNKTLVPADDIQVFLDALGPFIPFSWNRVHAWSIKLCAARGLPAVGLPQGRVVHPSRNPSRMYKLYKAYLGKIFTIQSGGATDHVLAWEEGALRIAKKAAVDAESTAFYFDARSDANSTLFITPYGMGTQRAVFCAPAKNGDAAQCSSVVHTDNKGYLKYPQWSCETLESYDDGSSLVELKQGNLYLDIYDSSDPELKWWTSAIKRGFCNQTWLLTPMFSAAELNDCC